MEVYNLFVSSENRDVDKYPSGNSYTLHLPTILHNVTRVELLQASVPNSIYNVTDGSNVISVSNVTTSNVTDLNLLVKFSIPVGFYDGCGLSTEISAAIYNDTHVQVDYLEHEGKFFFYREGLPFTVVANTPEMQNLLKLDVPTDSQVPPTVTSPTYTPLFGNNLRYQNKNFVKSSEVVTLHPAEGIFLDIEELRTTFNRDAKKLESNTFSGETMTRSFGMIPLDVSSGCIKRFKKANDYDFTVEYSYPIQSLSRLTVNWIDRLGKSVNFNGASDNSFLLRIHTDFEKEGILEIPEQPVLYENVKRFNNLFILAGVVLIIGLIMLLLIRR